MNTISGTVTLEAKHWLKIGEYCKMLNIEDHNEMFEVILEDWFKRKDGKIKQSCCKKKVNKFGINDSELFDLFNELSYERQLVLINFLHAWMLEDKFEQDI